MDEQKTDRGFWEELQKILQPQEEKPCECCQKLQRQLDARQVHCQNLQQQLNIWQDLCDRYSETDLSIKNLKQAYTYLCQQQ